jgi:hypothetical protein
MSPVSSSDTTEHKLTVNLHIGSSINTLPPPSRTLCPSLEYMACLIHVSWACSSHSMVVASIRGKRSDPSKAVSEWKCAGLDLCASVGEDPIDHRTNGLCLFVCVNLSFCQSYHNPHCACQICFIFKYAFISSSQQK